MGEAWEGVVAFCVMAPLAWSFGGRRLSIETLVDRVPGLPWLGLVSSGIYIWQYLLIVGIDRDVVSARGTWSSISFVATALLSCVAVGALSYYVVERTVPRAEGPP